MKKWFMEPFRIDDSRMPLRLGSALRVPEYAYPEWGITRGEYRIESDATYTGEWREGSPRQMQYVIEALSAAGFQNNSQLARNSSARIVANRARNLLETPGICRISYMDVGAGVSTINAFDALDADCKDRVFITLVEPSEKRVEAVAAELDKRGLKRGADYRVIVAPDQHLMAFVGPGTQDIVSYVATFHHHSYIDTPARHVNMVLRPGGTLVIADWHNPEWEHPARVYDALREDFDVDRSGWETKHEDLVAFMQAYPKANEPAPPLSPLDRASYMEIRGFWKGWAKVRRREIEEGTFDERDDILMLEAHRPVERQNEVLDWAGFDLHPEFEQQLIGDGAIKSNPDQLLETSRLMMTTVAQKARDAA
jgi:SAM-dependent methyltransferase